MLSLVTYIIIAFFSCITFYKLYRLIFVTWQLFYLKKHNPEAYEFIVDSVNLHQKFSITITNNFVICAKLFKQGTDKEVWYTFCGINKKFDKFGIFQILYWKSWVSSPYNHLILDSFKETRLYQDYLKIKKEKQTYIFLDAIDYRSLPESKNI